METNVPPHASTPETRPQTGLAIAALIVGVVAFFSSILLVGALLGVVGVLLAAFHIAKRRGPNGMAWTGLVLSILGLGISLSLGVLYFKAFASYRQHTEAQSVGGQPEEAPPAALAQWVGKKVPDFTVTTLEGKELRSTTWGGRRVVLDFWATWCPPCRLEIPHFIQLASEHSQDDLLIVGISSEDTKTLADFVRKEGIHYPIASSDDLPAPFDAINVIPTTFFIDRNGRIENVVVGYHDYERLKEMALDGNPGVEGDGAANDQP